MYKLVLESRYDGTDFVGFQIQDNGRSVQGVLEEALREIYKTDIDLTGCSRTDSGVHAACHVSSADAPFFIPSEKVPLALNAVLPPDVAVKSAWYAKEDFNARFMSLGKRYIYRIYSSPVRDPLIARYSYHTPYAPDISLMKEAASYMTGTLDYASFCAAGGSQNTTVRTVTEVNVTEDGKIPGLILIEVKGESFLYNMVRIMAGTLFYAGIGKISPEEVKMLFEMPDRKKAGKTLPACGLTLEEVYYDKERWMVQL